MLTIFISFASLSQQPNDEPKIYKRISSNISAHRRRSALGSYSKRSTFMGLEMNIHASCMFYCGESGRLYIATQLGTLCAGTGIHSSAYVFDTGRSTYKAPKVFIPDLP